MATILIKEIRRETVAITKRNRKLIVSLVPGDAVGLRLKGTRQYMEVSIGHVYNLAQIIHVEKIYQEKLKRYTLDKKAGKKVKRPKKPNLFLNPNYYKALK